MIDPVAGDGIVGIDDGADEAELANLTPLEMVDIAGAAVAFVMRPGNLDRGRRETLGIFQHRHTERDVALYDFKFLLRQPPWFVQDRRRDLHLAEVVHEAPDPEDIKRVGVVPQVAAKGEPQDTHAQGVLRRVFILALEMGEADERIGVAQHAFGHRRHDLLGARRIEAPAQAGVFKYLVK